MNLFKKLRVAKKDPLSTTSKSTQSQRYDQSLIVQSLAKIPKLPLAKRKYGEFS